MPQIVGLTKSPGTGVGHIIERAAEHVLQDRFGQNLKWMMWLIYDYINLTYDLTLREFGTHSQNYEADVVILEKQENQVGQRKLAMDSRFENQKMAKLKNILLKRFYPGLQSRRNYKVGRQGMLTRSFGDWEFGKSIICNNGNCNQQWGFETKYNDTALVPNLAPKRFGLETPEQNKGDSEEVEGHPFHCWGRILLRPLS
ncbi:hypothetical protein EXN66_Car022015 [Channa argus]|uniref:RLR CTR domain-containing protein n=1 Tax=Channa argus TaxID=215402 RepID=A0A6G1QVJ7_CHAAH|nr:hypothetical protein EXN66_Car022015 [Channa argus]